MLVLSRRVNEAITIGNNIKIVVVGIKNGAVKLGLEVPPSIHVMRSEVVPRLQFDVSAQREPLVPAKEKSVKP